MRSLLLAAVLLCASPALARDTRLPVQTGLEEVARPARWGLGVMLGEPFGVSLKRYLGGVNAFDVYAAFAYGPGLRFGGDWLWELCRIARERELPDDVRQVGAEARQRVALWLARMAAGGVELSQFSEAMREISAMMDALTTRLLLAPWDGPRSGLKS